MEDLKIKKGFFVQNSQENIEGVYQFDKTKLLGEGGFGRVFKAVHNITKQSRAIKVIPKSKIKDPAKFAIEIEILKQVDHPNIIKLFETFEDARNVYLVFEMCEGGELFDRVVAKTHYTESEARAAFTDIMKCIHYCHQHGISHRDLKLENFVYATKALDSPLKMIDFGLSKVFKSEDEILEENEKKSAIAAAGVKQRKKVVMQTKAGTADYMSPEVLDGNYNEKCDIWSAGVILYMILSGTPPFYGKDDAHLVASIKKGAYRMTGKPWDTISEPAKDLIKKMIVPQESRIDSQAVLDHPWMKMQNKGDDTPIQIDLDNLKSFVNMSKLKQVALHFIASQADEKDIDLLIKEFNQFDADGDGEISIQEFKNTISKFHKAPPEEIERIFKLVDSDNSGRINYTEFIAATMNQNIYLREEKLYQAFKMFDKNNDGVITPDEIKAVLGSDPKYKDQDTKMWERIIEDADTNKDGHIDYDEFIKLMGKI